jgi:hypothetical protein
VVSQDWLHASWRPRFTASHLSWTTCPRLQHQAAVKVHGVFPSSHGYSASSPRLQFHRVPRRDSAQVVTPFVQVGTSRSSSVSGGADYPFTWRSLASNASASYRRLPLGFIPRARSTISMRPALVRCAPAACNLQTAASLSKSSLFPEISG